jgi:hypothetical protein
MEASALRYRRLRAPHSPNTALVEPPLTTFGELLSTNQQLVATSPLAEWIPVARAELIRAAIAYTSAYREVPTLHAGRPVVLSGHQPQLFHAGVWFKNFLLSEIAQRQAATAINLVVDNDVVDAPAVRVPSGHGASPFVESVLIDEGSPGVPYEERNILDEACFTSFAQRVIKVAGPADSTRLVEPLWTRAIQTFDTEKNLGRVLARARHLLERDIGLSTLEVPLSVVYSQPSFRLFALRLLRESRRLAEVYNGALHEYRKVNGVRSRSHPVPDLSVGDEGCEAPLWIWTSAAPHRRRLFVRKQAGQLVLSDHEATEMVFPADDDGALAEWDRAERRGVKIRPRALITTMYARLVLSDLFLHGIGGAKYDELTDAIVAGFFGCRAPAYATATATVLLPLKVLQVGNDVLQRLESKLRDAQFHPELFASSCVAGRLVQRKRELLSCIPPRGTKRAWHEELVGINAAMQPFVAEQRADLEQRLAEAKEQHRMWRLLGSREFSFCLFSQRDLPRLLLDLARGNA